MGWVRDTRQTCAWPHPAWTLHAVVSMHGQAAVQSQTPSQCSCVTGQGSFEHPGHSTDALALLAWSAHAMQRGRLFAVDTLLGS